MFACDLRSNGKIKQHVRYGSAFHFRLFVDGVVLWHTLVRFVRLLAGRFPAERTVESFSSFEAFRWRSFFELSSLNLLYLLRRLCRVSLVESSFRSQITFRRQSWKYDRMKNAACSLNLDVYGRNIICSGIPTSVGQATSCQTHAQNLCHVFYVSLVFTNLNAFSNQRHERWTHITGRTLFEKDGGGISTR